MILTSNLFYFKTYKVLIISYYFCLFFIAFLCKKMPKDNRMYILLNNYDNPFFSIIIPVFNKFQYLNRSFSSILCQNFSNYEIIYCDDGSTDGSVEYIENLSHYYSKIRLIKHEKNLGTLNTRVDAIRSAEGRYIVSLDPDDEYKCGLLNELHKYLSHKRYDIVEFQNIKWQHKTKHLFNESKFVELNRSALLNRRVLWSLVLKCFRREVLLKGIDNLDKKFFDMHISSAEDLVILLYTLVFCDNYLIIDYGVYYYYQYLPGSSSACGYLNCKKKKKLVRSVWRDAKNFWLKNKLNFVHVLPK